MSELPIPKHLKPIFKPLGSKNSEFEVNGEIVCKCGCKEFKINLVGDNSNYAKHPIIKVKEIAGNFFFIVKLECNNCQSKNLLFDSDYHGWNGFVCGGMNKNVPRPSGEAWLCDECNSKAHKLQLKIDSQGKEDFMEESQGDFEEKDWPEGFSWITIQTECVSCDKVNLEWTSFETM